MTDDERDIRALVEAWMSASKAGDVHGLLALMTDDVIFMTPGRPPFGKAEFATDARAMSDLTMDGRSEIQEIEIMGNRAYVRSHIRIALTKGSEAPKRMVGYALSILRKEDDGHWRLARDANLVLPERA